MKVLAIVYVLINWCFILTNVECVFKKKILLTYFIHVFDTVDYIFIFNVTKSSVTILISDSNICYTTVKYTVYTVCFYCEGVLLWICDALYSTYIKSLHICTYSITQIHLQKFQHWQLTLSAVIKYMETCHNIFSSTPGHDTEQTRSPEVSRGMPR